MPRKMVIESGFLSKGRERLFPCLRSQEQNCSPSPAGLHKGSRCSLAFCSHLHFHQKPDKHLRAKGHNLASFNDTCQEKPSGDGPTLRDCSLVEGMGLSSCLFCFSLTISRGVQPPQLLVQLAKVTPNMGLSLLTFPAFP